MLTKACAGLKQYTPIWKGFLNEKFCTEWFVHSIAQAEKPTYHFCTTLYYIYSLLVSKFKWFYFSFNWLYKTKGKKINLN